MEQVQAASRRLAEATGDRLAALWALVEADLLTLARFRALAATLVTRANAQGVALADMGLTAEITRQLGRRAAPLGLRPNRAAVDMRRILADIDRIIANTPVSATTPEEVMESRQDQLRRLGRSETLLTVANAVQDGMARRGAQGWTRGLSGGSCPLCTSWADGVVRAATVRMARHPGCDCIQLPQF